MQQPAFQGQPPRDVCAILQDLSRERRCPEICFIYSPCGHCEEVTVALPPILHEARRNGRTALKVLKAQLKRSERDSQDPSKTFSSKAGSDSDELTSQFRMEIVPRQRCRACLAQASSAETGEVMLRCGGVLFSLPKSAATSGSGENGEAADAIPVALSAKQFLTYVQVPLQKDPQRFSLLSLTARHYNETLGSDKYGTGDPLGASLEPAFGGVLERIRCVTGVSPIFLGALLWVCGCFAYAVFQAAETSLVSPELFYEQLQMRIESIPVPPESPQYAKYKQYYMRQYQQSLQEFQAQNVQWQKNRPFVNWQALCRGLGAGALVFAALLVYCEYHYGWISSWMEIAEELWHKFLARRAAGPPDPLQDSKKMEKFLKEMGEEVQAPTAKEPKEQKEKERPQQLARTSSNSSKASDSPAPVSVMPSPSSAGLTMTARGRAATAPCAAGLGAKIAASAKDSLDISTSAKPEPSSKIQVSRLLPATPVAKEVLTPKPEAAPATPEPHREPSPEGSSRGAVRKTDLSAEDAKSALRQSAVRPVPEKKEEPQRPEEHCMSPKATPVPRVPQDLQAQHPAAAQQAGNGAWVLDDVPVRDLLTDGAGPVSNVRERLRRKVLERNREQIKQIVTQVVVSPPAPEPCKAPKAAPQAFATKPPAETVACKTAPATNSAAKPPAAAAGRPAASVEGDAPVAVKPVSVKDMPAMPTAPPKRGAELLREAEELLSQLEAEALLRQEEEEEERKRSSASMKAAKKKNKKAAAAAAASDKEERKRSSASMKAAKKKNKKAAAAAAASDKASSKAGATEEASKDAQEVAAEPEAVGIETPAKVESSGSLPPSPLERKASSSESTSAGCRESAGCSSRSDQSSNKESESEENDKGEEVESVGVSEEQEKASASDPLPVDQMVPLELLAPRQRSRKKKETFTEGEQRKARSSPKEKVARAARQQADDQPAITKTGTNQSWADIMDDEESAERAAAANAAKASTKASARYQLPPAPTLPPQPPCWLQVQPPAQVQTPAPRKPAPVVQKIAPPPTSVPVMAALANSKPQVSTDAPVVATRKGWATTPTGVKGSTQDSNEGGLSGCSSLVEELRFEDTDRILEWFDKNMAMGWLRKHARKDCLVGKKWKGSKADLLKLAAELLDPQEDQKHAESPGASTVTTQVPTPSSSTGTPQKLQVANRRRDTGGPTLSNEAGRQAGACILASLACNFGDINGDEADFEEPILLVGESMNIDEEYDEEELDDAEKEAQLTTTQLRAEAPEFVPGFGDNVSMPVEMDQEQMCAAEAMAMQAMPANVMPEGGMFVPIMQAPPQASFFDPHTGMQMVAVPVMVVAADAGLPMPMQTPIMQQPAEACCPEPQQQVEEERQEEEKKDTLSRKMEKLRALVSSKARREEDSQSDEDVLSGNMDVTYHYDCATDSDA
eukprot:TRINITY_DN5457_c0_g2_i7.p1 TRINITY_DN5457_c0_g2~~TRINITY_DN5457_c0_g2_i7.p1  ORF type:complete len:1421 (+),score=412.06 TRINITY_DN5457_c0_g2_i7:309-4571(+)